MSTTSESFAVLEASVGAPGTSVPQSPNFLSQLETMMGAVKQEANALERLKLEMTEMNDLKEKLARSMQKNDSLEKNNNELIKILKEKELKNADLKSDMQRLNDIYSKDRSCNKQLHQQKIELEEEISKIKLEKSEITKKWMEQNKIIKSFKQQLHQLSTHNEEKIKILNDDLNETKLQKIENEEKQKKSTQLLLELTAELEQSKIEISSVSAINISVDTKEDKNLNNESTKKELDLITHSHLIKNHVTKLIEENKTLEYRIKEQQNTHKEDLKIHQTEVNELKSKIQKTLEQLESEINLKFNLNLKLQQAEKQRSEEVETLTGKLHTQSLQAHSQEIERITVEEELRAKLVESSMTVETLQEKLKKKEKEENEVQNELNKRDDDIKVLKDQLHKNSLVFEKTLEDERSQHKRKTQTLVLQVEEINEARDKQALQISTVQEELKKVRSELVSAQTQIKVERKKSTGLLDEIDEWKNKIPILTKQLSERESAWVEERQTFLAREEQLKLELSSVEKRVKEVEARVNKQREDVSGQLQSDREELERTKNKSLQLVAQVKRSELLITQLQTDLESLKERHSQELQRGSEEVGGLQWELHENRQCLKEEKERRVELELSVERLRKEKTAWELDKKKEEERFLMFKDSFEGSEGKVKQLEEVLKKERESTRLLKSTSQRLEVELKAKSNRVEELTRDKNILEKSSRVETRKLRLELNSLKEENESIKFSLTQTQTELQENKNSFSKLQENFEAQRQSLLKEMKQTEDLLTVERRSSQIEINSLRSRITELTVQLERAKKAYQDIRTQGSDQQQNKTLSPSKGDVEQLIGELKRRDELLLQTEIKMKNQREELLIGKRLLEAKEKELFDFKTLLKQSEHTNKAGVKKDPQNSLHGQPFDLLLSPPRRGPGSSVQPPLLSPVTNRMSTSLAMKAAAESSSAGRPRKTPNKSTKGGSLFTPEEDLIAQKRNQAWVDSSKNGAPPVPRIFGSELDGISGLTGLSGVSQGNKDDLDSVVGKLPTSSRSTHSAKLVDQIEKGRSLYPPEAKSGGEVEKSDRTDKSVASVGRKKKGKKKVPQKVLPDIEQQIDLCSFMFE